MPCHSFHDLHAFLHLIDVRQDFFSMKIHVSLSLLHDVDSADTLEKREEEENMVQSLIVSSSKVLKVFSIQDSRQSTSPFVV